MNCVMSPLFVIQLQLSRTKEKYFFSFHNIEIDDKTLKTFFFSSLLQFNFQSISRWNFFFFFSTWRQHNVNSSKHVPHEQQKIFHSSLYASAHTHTYSYALMHWTLCANWIILKILLLNFFSISICIPMSNIFAIN